MTTQENLNSSKRKARIAGLLYLLLILSAIFPGYVYSRLIVPGEVTSTAQNIRANEWLFRSGFVSDLIHMTCYLLLAWALYVLLHQVNQYQALLMVLFVMVAVAIHCSNLLINYSARQILSDVEFMQMFDIDQLHTLEVLSQNMFENGVLIVQIFFGLWLLPLGSLVYQSDYFPRILGVLLILGCFGLLIECFQYFLFPSYPVITYPGLALSGLAEISFCLWLILKGVKDHHQFPEKPLNQKKASSSLPDKLGA